MPHAICNVRLWGAVAATLLTAGCAFNTQQRTQPGANSNADADGGEYSKYYKDRVGNHTTSVIEFDEQGDFWDPAQFVDAIKTIRASSKPVVLVVYAHGWENHSQSDDVRRFNENLLGRVDRSPLVNGQYNVIGVYLAWNGKQLHHSSPEPPGWDEVTALGFPFTFWGRKNDAEHRVAGNCTTEAIFSLASAARRRSPDSKVILIGHSFGAAVIERSVEQGTMGALLFQEVNNSKGSQAVALPADLVLLLNSATESIYAREFIDFFRRHPQQKRAGGNFISQDRPFIVSITSEADWATGFAFPVGTNIANLFGTFRNYKTTGKPISQRDFLTTTAGHNDTLISHRVIRPANSMPDLPAGRDAFELNLTSPQNGKVFAVNSTPSWFEIYDTGNPYNNTPYWVVTVPKEISSSHTDVWNPNIIDMFAELFRLSQASTNRGAAKMQMQSTPQTTTAPGVKSSN